MLIVKIFVSLLVADIVIVGSVIGFWAYSEDLERKLEKRTTESLQIIKKRGFKLDVTKTLLGTDQDANGIRDDIDDYIEKSSTKEFHRELMRDYAKAAKATLLVNPKDPQQTKPVYQEKWRAHKCIFERIYMSKSNNSFDFIPQDISQDILAMTINTKQRMKVYKKYYWETRNGFGDESKIKCDEILPKRIHIIPQYMEKSL